MLADPSGRHLSVMTKTQVRELKAILVVFGGRLRVDGLDDPLRVLAYRAQSLLDDAIRTVDERSIRKAG